MTFHKMCSTLCCKSFCFNSASLHYLFKNINSKRKHMGGGGCLMSLSNFSTSNPVKLEIFAKKYFAILYSSFFFNVQEFNFAISSIYIYYIWQFYWKKKGFYVRIFMPTRIIHENNTKISSYTILNGMAAS